MNENEKLEGMENGSDSIIEPEYFTENDQTEQTETDIQDENDTTEYNGTTDYLDEKDHDNDYTVEFESMPQKSPKKGFVIYTSLIIAACILLGSLMAYGTYKIFFTPSIRGSWVYTGDLETSEGTDAPIPYLTFDKNGIATYSIGTLEYYGPYTVNSVNGTSSLTAAIPYALSGTFDMQMEGNIFSDRKLMLTYNGQSIDFVKAKREDSTMQVSDDFSLVNEAVGKWYSEEQGVTYSVYSDGTMEFDLKSEDVGMHVEGVYTISDGTIKFEYMTNEVTTLDVEYQFNENGNMIIQGSEYINLMT